MGCEQLNEAYKKLQQTWKEHKEYHEDNLDAQVRNEE